MTNDKGELEVLEMLRKIRLEPDAKKVFLAMSREDQLLAILGIQAYTTNELATTQKDLHDLTETVKKNERNAMKYRKAREEREGDTIDLDEDTPLTQKIITTVKKRFDQYITMALLIYLIFGDKLQKMVSP